VRVRACTASCSDSPNRRVGVVADARQWQDRARDMASVFMLVRHAEKRRCDVPAGAILPAALREPFVSE
jgi:hypothetical protein